MRPVPEKPVPKKWRAALAALLLAALPVAIVSASPAAGSFDAPGSLAERVESAIAGWLASLLPGWATAGSETAPADPVSSPVPDGGSTALACDPTTCTEGETLPDFDPDG